MKRIITCVLLISVMFSCTGCSAISDFLFNGSVYNLRENNLKELEKQE